VLNLELKRRDRRWSQTELGQIADISQRAISAMERGAMWPNPEHRDRLARILDVPPELLMEPVQSEKAAPQREPAPQSTPQPTGVA
jgi:transcriptional regulator with XRE-family HTH domain